MFVGKVHNVLNLCSVLVLIATLSLYKKLLSCLLRCPLLGSNLKVLPLV
jgi:hypothetical protein